jgi:hypothetical protein
MRASVPGCLVASQLVASQLRAFPLPLTVYAPRTSVFLVDITPSPPRFPWFLLPHLPSAKNRHQRLFSAARDFCKMRGIPIFNAADFQIESSLCLQFGAQSTRMTVQ